MRTQLFNPSTLHDAIIFLSSSFAAPLKKKGPFVCKRYPVSQSIEKQTNKKKEINFHLITTSV